MSRSRHLRRLVAWVLTLGVHLGGLSAWAQQPALLDLTVNGIGHGQAFVLVEGGDVWVDAGALREAGISSPSGDTRPWNGRTLVRLASLAPSITGEFDERELALRLTVPATALGTTTMNLLNDRPPDIEYKRTPSAFLNYGLLGTTARNGSLSLEAGASAGPALVTSTVFGDDVIGFRRGLSALTLDDRRRMTRYVVGDAVAGTGVLGGSLQLAGVTVSRDFSLDPYFVRLPTIGLSGAALTPSRVEVYVNNQLVRVAQLPAGVYQLNQLQLPVGSADTRVVVRDAFGGEQTYSSSYYISQNILGRGIQQFSYSAGVERLDPFNESWSYGGPLFLGAHRVGISDSLTLGGRVEVSQQIASGGPMVTTRIGPLGQIETAAGFSHGPEGAGFAGSLAYEYVGRTFSISAAVRRLSPDYATVSTWLEPLRPRLDAGGTAATRFGKYITVGASWQSVAYYLGTPSMRRGALTSSVWLSRKMSLYLSATRSLIDGRWSTGGFAGLGVSISARQNANLSAEHERGVGRLSAEVQRALPIGPGYGYRVQTAATDTPGPANLNAEFQAQSSFGRVDLTQTVVDGEGVVATANVSGGLVLIGGGVHPTRALEDGYALVRVPNAPNVRTYLSHQEVGRTNHNGDLLVPNLLPYYGNRLSIDDADVPIDRDVPRNEMTLAPPYRGGAIALFPAPRPWRVIGRVVVMRGTDLITPDNWQLNVVLPAGAVETTLGDDGAFYLEGVAPGTYPATVSSATVSCRFSLRVPSASDPVVRAGVSACTAMETGQ